MSNSCISSKFSSSFTTHALQSQSSQLHQGPISTLPSVKESNHSTLSQIPVEMWEQVFTSMADQERGPAPTDGTFRTSSSVALSCSFLYHLVFIYRFSRITIEKAKTKPSARQGALSLESSSSISDEQISFFKAHPNIVGRIETLIIAADLQEMYKFGIDERWDVLLPLFTSIKHLDFSNFEIMWDSYSHPPDMQKSKMAETCLEDLKRLLVHFSSSVSTLEFSVDQLEFFSIIVSESSSLKKDLRLKNIILKPTSGSQFHFRGDGFRWNEMETNFKRILGYSDAGNQAVGKEGRVTIDLGQIGTVRIFSVAYYILARVDFPAVELGGSSMLEDDDAFGWRQDLLGRYKGLKLAMGPYTREQLCDFEFNLSEGLFSQRAMHEFITIPEEEELIRLLRMEEDAALRAAGGLTEGEQEDAFYSAYEGELGEILYEPDPFEDDHQALMEQEYDPYWYHGWDENEYYQ